MNPLAGSCFLLLLLCSVGCGGTRSDLDYSFAVEQTWVLQDPAVEITQFASVPWRPLKTEDLRRQIRQDQLVDSRSLLEIGAGTGLFAIVCAREGARRIVALACDPASEACARYNVAVDESDAVIEIRSLACTPAGASGQAGAPGGSSLDRVLGKAERFDWVVVGTEAQLPEELIFEVLESLPARLNGGGRCWVICTDQRAEQSVSARAGALGYRVKQIRSPQAVTAADGPRFPLTLQIDVFASRSSGPGDQAPLPPPPPGR